MIVHLFPLWAILLSIVAFFNPALFTEFKSWIIPLLTIIMFSMGLTLKPEDFKRILKMPTLVITGLVLQYSVMPVAAFILAKLFSIDPVMAVGMILVGASPGGTASNVMTYLARGNVALSISLTTVSTLLAVFLTPLITLFLADTVIDVPAGKMFYSILTMVIAPVLLGLLLHHFFSTQIKAIEPVLPLIAVTAIVLIIAIITALNAGQLAQLSGKLFLAIVLHNAIGLLLAWLIARKLGYDKPECRTLAIEVGMQNSGLAVALAIKHFSAAAALPGAIFSIWHNISGSLLSFFWSKRCRQLS